MLTMVPPKRGSKYPLSFQRLGGLPLPAYIELDLEDRAVSFTYWDRNTEPMYVTLGHARRWSIDPMISRLAAVKLAKGLEPLMPHTGMVAVMSAYSILMLISKVTSSDIAAMTSFGMIPTYDMKHRDVLRVRSPRHRDVLIRRPPQVGIERRLDANIAAPLPRSAI